MAERIIIDIAPDGTVSGDVAEGPGGPKCLASLYKLLGDLGSKTKATKKPEFYAKEGITTKARKAVKR